MHCKRCCFLHYIITWVIKTSEQNFWMVHTDTDTHTQFLAIVLVCLVCCWVRGSGGLNSSPDLTATTRQSNSISLKKQRPGGGGRAEIRAQHSYRPCRTSRKSWLKLICFSFLSFSHGLVRTRYQLTVLWGKWETEVWIIMYVQYTNAVQRLHFLNDFMRSIALLYTKFSN